MIDDVFAPHPLAEADPLGLGELLKPSEVASALRVNVATIGRMIDRGELPTVQIGNVRRIPAAGLKARLRTT